MDSSIQQETGISHSQDYFTTLGLPFIFDEKQLERAFAKKVLYHHPNRWWKRKKQDTETFMQAYEAREVLADKSRRSKYRYLYHLDVHGKLFKGVELTPKQLAHYRQEVMPSIDIGRQTAMEEVEWKWFTFRERYARLSFTKVIVRIVSFFVEGLLP